MLEKLGGRKFLLALIAVVIGALVETLSKNGMSATFGSYMAGLVIAFNATNHMSNVAALNAAGSTQPGEGITAEHVEGVQVKLDAVHSAVKSVQDIAAAVGTSVANTNKLVAASLAPKKDF